MLSSVRIPMTPSLKSDLEATDAIADLAGRIRARHPDAAEMIDSAVDGVLRNIENASQMLGIQFERRADPRGPITLVHSDTTGEG